MSATSIYKRTLIGFACGAVLVFVACALLYCNRSGKLHKLQVEMNQKQKQMDSSEKIAARLPVARKEFLDAQEKLSFLEQGVSSKVYVPTFLRQIEELGKKNHLQVAGVRPRPAEVKPVTVSQTSNDEKDGKGDNNKTAVKALPPDPYDKLELDIEMRGKYWDIVQFMHEITSFPKIVAVNDIQISPIDQKETLASPALSLRFNATAFILKQQPGVGPAGSKTANVIAEAGDGDKG